MIRILVFSAMLFLPSVSLAGSPLEDCPGPGCPSGSVSISDEELLEKLIRQLESTEERTRGLGLITGTGVRVIVDPSASLGETKHKGFEYPGDPSETAIIEFSFNSAEVSGRFLKVIEGVCRSIQPLNSHRLIVFGHASSAGSEAYNLFLSFERARRVTHEIRQKCGIHNFKIEPIGLGERFPLSVDDPSAAENRRAEIHIYE